ncbi:MAG: hypothetical protein F4X66_07120 [Chloroflexi bacterium]|nr:hypothetical protein [Chloroflexota bacterium]MYE39024.1 hypothetical protein [Chloroflexota bacterium]
MIQSLYMSDWNTMVGATVSATRLRRMLDELAADAGDVSSSLYLAPGDSPDPAAMAATGWAAPLFEFGDGALRDGCGLVGLRAGDRGLLIAPPFPVNETFLALDWDDEPLRNILGADFDVGVVLVRLGRFSVAVFRGGEMLDSKTDSRYVKGKHHAGGTSQLRYTRVRDGQIKRLYDKVCEETRAHLLPPAAEQLDYLVLGGERFTLNGLVKQCPALASLQPITLKRRLNIRDPKRDTLPQVAAMLTESRVWEIEFTTESTETTER